MNSGLPIEALTERLSRWFAGREPPERAVIEAVYEALRRLAKSALAREAPGHTLQPTALINEAFIELAHRGTQFLNRDHFLAHATVCMRHILVDHARQRQALKRGADWRVEWTDSLLGQAGEANTEELLALDTALSELARLDARRAQVIELGYFGGLKRDEIATVLGLSVRTVDRELRLGEAFLAEALS